MITKTAVILHKDQNKRLDIALTEILQDLPRKDIKKCIESNNVMVNGKLEYRANYKVQQGDEIRISIDDKVLKPLVPQDIELDIIYEDADVIIVDKPSGLTVHPSTKHEEKSVLNALVHYFGKGEKNITPKLVHRIDKNTSGVLIVAKTVAGQRHYASQFAEKNVRKTYVALTSGRVKKQYHDKLEVGFEIRTFITKARNPKQKMKLIRHNEKGSKEAITKFKLLDMNVKDQQYLFQLHPQTGRTHQLRLHCTYIGLPVVGDHMYGGKKYKRLMLHASSLEVVTLQGKTIKFESKPSKEFRRA